MKTVWKILILILIVTNNTYGSNRGNTEPVEITSNDRELGGTVNFEIWKDMAATIDIGVQIPFSVSFPNLDVEYRMDDIAKMTLEEKVNFAIVFVILSNSYVNKEDMKILYELLPRKMED